MRIAELHMDAQDKTRFEILGKSSVKYHLKANHVVEAKRWFWVLNNAIQWSKDEARAEEKQRSRDADLLRQAKKEAESGGDAASITSAKPSGKGLFPATAIPTSTSKISFQSSLKSPESTAGDDGGSVYDSYEPSLAAGDLGKITSNATVPHIQGDVDDDEEYGEDASSRELQPVNKDAFNITAQSAKLQLDLLSQVSHALQAQKAKNPQMLISDRSVDQALNTYETAVNSLNGLVVDLLKISRDRDAYWQYRLDREADARKMWEDSMARVAKEHEELQEKIGESEDKRKRTKRALKEALEGASVASSRSASRGPSQDHIQIAEALENVQKEERRPSQRRKSISTRDRRRSVGTQDINRRKSIIVQYTDLSDSESGDDEEFFDAVDAGEIEIVEDLPIMSPPLQPVKDMSAEDLRQTKKSEIQTSFKGYDEPPRQKMRLDADNRPKISLWVRKPSSSRESS